MQLPLPLKSLDADECPTGVPLDFWTMFVREADKIRSMGRDHYGARTIAEYVRHNAQIESSGRHFVVNNNWIPDCAKTYNMMRGCFTFFEMRGVKKFSA